MKTYLKTKRIRKNSETWHVVYIDLMTNLMIIFVILWATHHTKPSKNSTKVGDTTSHTVSLPGDVIFPPGKTFLSADGKTVFKNLFGQSETGQVLNFDTGGFTKRYIIIHGHTDGDGKKEDNFQLGFDRALATYREVQLYSKDLPQHVILCSHADNSPLQEITLSDKGEALRAIKAKNRRITIEDKVESRVQMQ